MTWWSIIPHGPLSPPRFCYTFQSLKVIMERTLVIMSLLFTSGAHRILWIMILLDYDCFNALLTRLCWKYGYNRDDADDQGCHWWQSIVYGEQKLKHRHCNTNANTDVATQMQTQTPKHSCWNTDTNAATQEMTKTVKDCHWWQSVMKQSRLTTPTRDTGT